MPVRVLIVEQTDTTRDAFLSVLERAGMDAYGASSVPEAAELFAKRGAHIVVLDLLMISGNAFAFMAGVLGAMPNTRVIATTASGAMRQASAAVTQGAFDYLVKPIDSKRLLRTVRNAIDGRFETSAAQVPYVKALFGAAHTDIERMAPSMAPILIEGEVGTCKQDCAALIHEQSHRAKLPFVTRACAAFSGKKLEHLFSSTLLRHGGTLYLADANKLSLGVQTQLLRFLQTPVFDGDADGIEHSNVRIILGISSNLETEVDAGRFREDLFYRLKVVRIVLAPLHTRAADIPMIAQAFLNRMSKDANKPQKVLADDAGSILSRMTWTGNHGELRHVLAQALKNHRSKVVRAEMLPDAVLKAFVDVTRADPPVDESVFLNNADSSIADLVKAGWALADLERLVIELTISQNGGSVPKAAKQLSVSPSTLYRKREAWSGKTR